MKILYDNLNIEFNIDNVSFSTLNIALEQFLTSVPKHSHGNNNYELHYVSQGYGIAMVEQVAYELSPNTLYITGPHVEHEQIPFPSDPMVEYSIFFTIRRGDSKTPLFDMLSSHPEKPFIIGKGDVRMRQLFENIFAEFRTPNIGYMYQVSALLQQCVILAMRRLQKDAMNSNTDADAGPAHLSDRRAFITDKAFLYEYNTLTLQKLSADLGLSTRQTERFLDKHYKKNFSQKLLEARMSAAVVLLSRPGLSLLEIAERIGYSSVEYFSDLFKKYYSISPRKYRQGLLKKSQ